MDVCALTEKDLKKILEKYRQIRSAHDGDYLRDSPEAVIKHDRKYGETLDAKLLSKFLIKQSSDAGIRNFYPKGLILKDILVSGDLNLILVQNIIPLSFIRCKIKGNIFLEKSNIQNLFIDECVLESSPSPSDWQLNERTGDTTPFFIHGRDAVIQKGLSIRNSHVIGTLSFIGAKIENSVDLSGSIFSIPVRPHGYIERDCRSVDFSRSKIGGDVNLSKISSHEIVDFTDVTVLGNVQIDMATLRPANSSDVPDSTAIYCKTPTICFDDTEIGQGVLIQNCHLFGELNFQFSKVHGQFYVGYDSHLNKFSEIRPKIWNPENVVISITQLQASEVIFRSIDVIGFIYAEYIKCKNIRFIDVLLIGSKNYHNGYFFSIASLRHAEISGELKFLNCAILGLIDLRSSRMNAFREQGSFHETLSLKNQDYEDASDYIAEMNEILLSEIFGRALTFQRFILNGINFDTIGFSSASIGENYDVQIKFFMNHSFIFHVHNNSQKSRYVSSELTAIATEICACDRWPEMNFRSAQGKSYLEAIRVDFDKSFAACEIKDPLISYFASSSCIKLYEFFNRADIQVFSRKLGAKVEERRYQESKYRLLSGKRDFGVWSNGVDLFRSRIYDIGLRFGHSPFRPFNFLVILIVISSIIAYFVGPQISPDSKHYRLEIITHVKRDRDTTREYNSYFGGVDRRIIEGNPSVHDATSPIIQFVAVADRPNDYPAFYPILFSIDSIIPFIDFGQEKYWSAQPVSPDPDFVDVIRNLSDLKCGGFDYDTIKNMGDKFLFACLIQNPVTIFFIFSKILGWILTTFAIISFSRLLRTK